MAWGAIAGAVISGLMSSNGQDAATGAGLANQQAQQGYNAQVDPLSTTGMRGEYANQLNTLMQGGVQGLQNDPNLQFLQKQQEQAVQRQFSAAGQQTSSNEMQALMAGNYKTNMDYFNQQYNRLATLANANGGGGGAAFAQSPGQAFQGANSTAGNYADAAGQIGGGLQQLFGSGTTSNQPTNTTSSGSTNYGSMPGYQTSTYSGVDNMASTENDFWTNYGKN